MSTNHQKILPYLLEILPIGLVLSGCFRLSATTPTPEPSPTPQPTYTLRPTYTPLPTYTPYPTYTVIPTASLYPTYTPFPTPITPTETPTFSPIITNPAGEIQTCNDSSGPRQKVRVENITGDSVTLYLFGPENYICSIPPGTNRIYVLNGVYDLGAHMCGGELYEFGSHVINPTWLITLKCP